MKKYFVETNADNMVVFVDEANKAYAFDEITFDFPLTLETAITADYGNCDGCETAVDIAYAVGKDERDVFDWDENEYEHVVDITAFVENNGKLWDGTENVPKTVEWCIVYEIMRQINGAYHSPDYVEWFPWGLRVIFVEDDYRDEYDVFADCRWVHRHGLVGAGQLMTEDCGGDNVFALDDCQWI